MQGRGSAAWQRSGKYTLQAPCRGVVVICHRRARLLSVPASRPDVGLEGRGLTYPHDAGLRQPRLPCPRLHHHLCAMGAAQVEFGRPAHGDDEGCAVWGVWWALFYLGWALTAWVGCTSKATAVLPLAGGAPHTPQRSLLPRPRSRRKFDCVLARMLCYAHVLTVCVGRSQVDGPCTLIAAFTDIDKR